MWFTETPWPPAIALVVAAVLFALAWSGNRRTLYAGLAIGALLLIPAVFLIERLIVTTAEQVEQEVHALLAAVVRDDVDATLDFFTKTALIERGLVVTGMSLGTLRPDARITDLSVEVTAEDTVAVTHFRANGTFVGRELIVSGEHHVATRWRLSWRKEAGDWKIFEVVRLDPIKGEAINILSAQ